jgi:periplasmic protein CpxP/Spy
VLPTLEEYEINRTKSGGGLACHSVYTDCLQVFTLPLHPTQRKTMTFNWKTISLASLSAMTLIAAPLAMTHLAQAQELGRDGLGHDRFEQLDLTEAQSTQLETIRNNTRSQIQAVLTPEQQTTLDNEGPRGLKSLGFSEDQRSQIRSIREASKEEIGTVLTDEQQQLAQMHRGRGAMGGEGRHPLEQLDLTEDQSTQIEAIRSDVRSQIQDVLTSEQQEIVENEGPRSLRSLDLSEDQRSQIRSIREDSEEEIEAVLNDEQRQQLEQMRENREERRSDRQDDRGDRRSDRQDDREERRSDRRENRQENRRSAR